MMSENELIQHVTRALVGELRPQIAAIDAHIAATEVCIMASLADTKAKLDEILERTKRIEALMVVLRFETLHDSQPPGQA